MKQRRISNSPLMDPAVCALVIIAPDPQDLAIADPILRTGHRRASAAVTKAADIVDVPVFTLSRRAKKQKASLAASAPGISFHRRFVFEEDVSPWSKAFVDALAAVDRSILILAGGTALHALAESYDVCVLLDATPPRCPHASQPAQDRLNQAGATPVVTSQAIHEWTIETVDAAKRLALNSLLFALMQGG
jgi:hypothetical protein